jgi:hypothetical protein
MDINIRQSPSIKQSAVPLVTRQFEFNEITKDKWTELFGYIRSSIELRSDKHSKSCVKPIEK